ncbi:MAG: hypothetical protein DRR16_14810 [Candidatus Parabeggiatoa sp. nov. 3]|nr:MAG: hypothetical protein DRR00_20205 [Gammaproteobacteria bacterium]RKZ63377.1 MAG: hypothetical protein DRQ99_17245 [Gammaproteobacteria bacterium]RKZ84400.1 MAG: hypothetical protein DRR16_14810 [Gammaproteobacteria bacterium]
MTTDPILNTLEKIVHLHDGIAESSQPNTLNVLLPETVAKWLELDEEVTFTTTADVRDGYFVTYSSDILKQFEALLQEKGYVATLGVKYEGYLKTTGFEKTVTNALKPLNGLIRVQNAKEKITPYWLCNMAYVGQADENRLGLVSFFLNALTGVAPIEIGDALLWESDRMAVVEESPELSVSFETLSGIIENISQSLIEDELENWQKSLRRKQQRDEDRLTDYYSIIIQEIKEKIEKKHLQDEDKQRELDRIEATKMESKRKLADIRERYALKVEAQMHSALVVQLPTVHIACELIRKKQRRPITVIWNPFSKQIEPLRCEESNVPVSSFYLSNDEVKILSAECWH